MAFFVGAEKRLEYRAKCSRLVRVRPSLPMEREFEEVAATNNSSRHGCYFASHETRYSKQMRLFVSFPYSAEHGAINRDYLAEIVRLDTLRDGRTGVAMRFLSTVGLALPK